MELRWAGPLQACSIASRMRCVKFAHKVTEAFYSRKLEFRILLPILIDFIIPAIVLPKRVTPC